VINYHLNKYPGSFSKLKDDIIFFKKEKKLTLSCLAAIRRQKYAVYVFDTFGNLTYTQTSLTSLPLALTRKMTAILNNL